MNYLRAKCWGYTLILTLFLGWSGCGNLTSTDAYKVSMSSLSLKSARAFSDGSLVQSGRFNCPSDYNVNPTYIDENSSGEFFACPSSDKNNLAELLIIPDSRDIETVSTYCIFPLQYESESRIFWAKNPNGTPVSQCVTMPSSPSPQEATTFITNISYNAVDIVKEVVDSEVPNKSRRQRMSECLMGRSACPRYSFGLVPRK